MIASAEYLKQDQGFLLENAIYSLLLGPTDGTELVGRIGYEKIFDPGITDVKGLIWSSGIITRMGKFSAARVEYGHRYGKPTWNVSTTLAASAKLYLTGGYERTLETIQARLDRSLTDLTDRSPEFRSASRSCRTIFAYRSSTARC